MSNEREAFEAWAVNQGLALHNQSGGYRPEIQAAWMAWRGKAEWQRSQQSAPAVDELAAFIRQIDGNNRMGAGALAESICEWLSAAPKAEAQEENMNRKTLADDLSTLDQQMKAAGMITLTELLSGQPLDMFIKNAGVVDLETFGQWLSRRHLETQKARARMDLEKKEGDELYEWTLAHAATFHEVMVNFRAAMAASKH